MTQLLEVTKTYDLDAIWDALVGADFAGLNYWITEMDCLWTDKWAPFPVTYDDEEGEQVTVEVTKDMLLSGFTKAVQEGATHCDGHRIDDLDDYDACFADAILQRAIFGEVIYG